MSKQFVYILLYPVYLLTWVSNVLGIHMLRIQLLVFSTTLVDNSVCSLIRMHVFCKLCLIHKERNALIFKIKMRRASLLSKMHKTEVFVDRGVFSSWLIADVRGII